MIARDNGRGPRFRRGRQQIAAHEEDVGRGHKVGVILIIEPADGVDIGGNGNAGTLGDRQERAGEIDVAERGQATARQRPFKVRRRKLARLNVFQVSVNLSPSLTIVEDDGLGRSVQIGHDRAIVQAGGRQRTAYLPAGQVPPDERAEAYVVAEHGQRLGNVKAHAGDRGVNPEEGVIDRIVD